MTELESNLYALTNADILGKLDAIYDRLEKLETMKGKVISDVPGSPGDNVATPGTAHPRAELPPFHSVNEIVNIRDGMESALRDFCREHEQRIKVLARFIEFIESREHYPMSRTAREALQSAGLWPLPEGW